MGEPHCCGSQRDRVHERPTIVVGVPITDRWVAPDAKASEANAPTASKSRFTGGGPRCFESSTWVPVDAFVDRCGRVRNGLSASVKDCVAVRRSRRSHGMESHSSADCRGCAQGIWMAWASQNLSSCRPDTSASPQGPIMTVMSNWTRLALSGELPLANGSAPGPGPFGFDSARGPSDHRTRSRVSRRTGARVAEGAGLLNRYTVAKPYRGFESPPVRLETPLVALIARSASWPSLLGFGRS